MQEVEVYSTIGAEGFMRLVPDLGTRFTIFKALRSGFEIRVFAASVKRMVQRDESTVVQKIDS
jgi:hypothetical protein